MRQLLLIPLPSLFLTHPDFFWALDVGQGFMAGVLN